MLYHFYPQFLQPRSLTEDGRRRELILTILLLGMISLSICATLLAASSLITHTLAYSGASLILLTAISAVFIAMYLYVRAGYARLVSYIFTAVMFIFATYPLVTWGVLLPQGILTYALLIVISGVLLDSRAAFRITLLMTVVLMLIKYLEATKVIHFNTAWMHQTGGYNDVIVYGITFSVIALVSWLSNREIEQSLRRARKSEKDLLIERNSLEVKVKQRTKELERAQVEKMLELHRFAEFGRFSSTLLHDLTNPLTAVSLNLEQLETTQRSGPIRQARLGITFIERYVDAARRQLRNQSEIKLFDVADEVERVIDLLEPKAKTYKVKIKLQLAVDLKILGDSARFNQIIANLVANAIDSYHEVKRTDKLIMVIVSQVGGDVQIKVTDNGIGIAHKDLAHIFEPFYTTKDSQRGTGLGLTITRQIIEEDFGGTIEAESTKKVGTSFRLVLPLS